MFRTHQAIRDERHAHMLSTPVILKDRIYFTDESWNLYCLDRTTGNLHWESRALWSQNESICVFENRLFLKTRHLDEEDYTDEKPGYVCINKDGEIIWSFNSKGSITTLQPTILEGNLIFGDKAGFLYGVEASSGHLAWQTDVKTAVQKIGSFNQPAHPCYYSIGAGKNIVVNAGSSLVFLAVNAETGNIEWIFFGDKPSGNPATDLNNLCFISLMHSRVYLECVDLITGKQLWEVNLHPHKLGDSSVYPGTGLIVGEQYITSFNRSAKVAAFNTENGSLTWSYQCEAGLSASPIFIGGRLLVGDHFGNVYCFEQS